MSLLSSFKKRSTLDAAIKQVAKARKSDGGLAEQLYKGAYQGFAATISDHLIVSEALYNWGFALLNEANMQTPELAKATLEDAVAKFSFCLLTAPHYLGAAIDGGVAYMSLARLNDNSTKAFLYGKAKEFFQQADSIQKGSASYNLACLFAISGDETACMAALEQAKQFGSLPDKAEILQDVDMATVIELPWFTAFFAELGKPKTPEEKAQEEAVSIEPTIKLRKTEDFDYYAKSK